MNKPDKKFRKKRQGIHCLKGGLFPGVLLVSGLSAAGGASAAFLQPPTSAGQLSSQLRQEAEVQPQALTAPDLQLPAAQPGQHPPQGETGAARVVLSQVRFTGEVPGQKADAAAALQQLTAPWLGRPLSFADLQALTEAVTQYYRGQGLLVARAVLPPQKIQDGVLTVQVVPGLYDEASVINRSALKTGPAVRLVAAAAPAGSPVTKDGLTRMALLLADIPGVSAQVSLKPGAQPGTSSAEVTLTPGKRFGGYAGLDNQGDPTTGRSRVMAGFYAGELLGYGDRLRVDVLDAYENSDLFSGSADYSLLAGSHGTRVGAAYSHLNYHYTFMAGKYSGSSDNWGLYAVHPLVRRADARADIRADAGQQYLTDKYPWSLPSLGSEGRKRVTLASVSVSGSVAAVPGGVTGFSLKGTAGSTDYRTAMSRFMSSGDVLGTSGRFTRLNYDLNHEQQVSGAFSVYAGLNGQYSPSNLDSSQKFLLGGPNAVRAYEIGTGSVDSGTAGTAEVRWHQSLPWLRLSAGVPSVTVAGFYDQGAGQQFTDNRLNQRNNHVTMSGAGLYTAVTDAGNYGVTLTWAHRTGHADPVTGKSDRDRFWVSAVKNF